MSHVRYGNTTIAEFPAKGYEAPESFDGYPSKTEQCANIDLFLAAPDLYEALKELLPEGWGDNDTMDHMPGVRKARLALARAEGRKT